MDAWSTPLQSSVPITIPLKLHTDPLRKITTLNRPRFADLKAASLRRSFSLGTARCVPHTMASWLSGLSMWGRTSWRTIL
jgi:hypothetical protein